MGSLLLRLPPEVLLEVIQSLHEDYRFEWIDRSLQIKKISWSLTKPLGEWHGKPLRALRLTCKHLSNLCTPTLFQYLDVTWLRDGGQETLFHIFSKSGHVVKDLCLNMAINGWSQAETEEFNARVLGHCNTLRRLAIFHERDDKSKPQLLFGSVCNLSSLEEIRIIEDGHLGPWSEIRVSEAPNYLSHLLLDVVLDAHASHLRTIILFGVTPLTIATFEKIQHKTPRLHRLEITRGLAVHHRESLAAPNAWACAANLQHVSLTRCRGAHAALFTQQLAAGAIGHLRTLHMSICGAHSDDVTFPVAAKWTIPALEVLELDHFLVWEMRHLAMIHARKVFLSRVWQVNSRQDAQAVIMAMTDTTTFPGAIELHVTSEWRHKAFTDLRTACVTRNIKVVGCDWEFTGMETYLGDSSCRSIYNQNRALYSGPSSGF